MLWLQKAEVMLGYFCDTLQHAIIPQTRGNLKTRLLPEHVCKAGFAIKNCSLWKSCVVNLKPPSLPKLDLLDLSSTPYSFMVKFMCIFYNLTVFGYDITVVVYITCGNLTQIHTQASFWFRLRNVNMMYTFFFFFYTVSCKCFLICTEDMVCAESTYLLVF